MTNEPLNLQAVAEQAAKRDLLDMAVQGMKDWQEDRDSYSTRIWQRWQRGVPRQSIYDLMPKAQMAFPSGACASGLFAGLWLHEIAELVFSKTALEFILQHSYNRYLFWRHVTSALSDTTQVKLPLSLADVQRKLVTNQTPFGESRSVYSCIQSNKLKLAIARMGGTFDIEKLDLAYGFFLISSGLILQSKEQDYSDLPKLLLNPMWAKFVESLQAKSASNTDSKQTS